MIFENAVSKRKIPNIAFLAIILFAVFSAYITIWPNPRIAIPFLGVVGLVLLAFPFKRFLAIFIVFAIAHNLSHLSVFKVGLGGFNVFYLEIALIFLLGLMFVELITGSLRIEIDSMFVLLGSFAILIVIQIIRGFISGFDFDHMKVITRSLAYYPIIIPIAFFWGSGGTPRKMINIALIGWTLALIYYLSIYFGVFQESLVSPTGRLAWAPFINAICFIPLLLLIITTHDAERLAGKKFLLWLLFGATIFALPLTQTRAIFLIIMIEIIPLFFISVALQEKGKRLSFAIKTIIIVVLLIICGFFIMKSVFGEQFDYFIFNVMSRLRTFAFIRRDFAVIARFTQILETFKIIKENILFGGGVGVEWHSQKFFGGTGIDNVYFTILGQHGIVGFLLFLSIIFLWFKRSLFILKNKNKLDDPIELAFSSAQPLVIVGICASGFTEGAYYFAPPNYILLIVFAMTTEKIYQNLKKRIILSANDISPKLA